MFIATNRYVLIQLYIYVTNNAASLCYSPPAVQYVSKHSKGQIAVVENEEQLQKFLAIKSQLPDLKGK